jgi:hypothetical protein
MVAVGTRISPRPPHRPRRALLRPEQIDLGRTSARGVVDFKHFLEFAEHGARAIAEAFSVTGRETDSPFEDAVMRALQDRGWEFHPEVGVSFFRVDLGVVQGLMNGSLKATYPVGSRDLVDAQAPAHRALQIASATTKRGTPLPDHVTAVLTTLYGEALQDGQPLIFSRIV